MKFSYNFLQDYISKKLPEPKKLAELLTMHSYEVESFKKVGSDYIFDIDILPNRAHDSSSHIGVSREVVAILNQGHGGQALKTTKLKVKKYKELKSNKNNIGELVVSVGNKVLCPRYMVAVIRGISVKKSPKWLRDRLHGIGINSINNIVDAANYAMLATGQPLHGFDYNKLSGGKILVREAKQGEIIETLDGVAYILDTSMLVIADEKDVLAIAGIKGGKKAEVDVNTKNIILEAAYFDVITIRNTAKKLGLHTDASWRFEHGMPIENVKNGLYMVIDLILQIAGGKSEKQIIDTLSLLQTKKVISIDPLYAEKLLGFSLTSDKVAFILKTLEFSVKKEKNFLKVEVPEFRLDIEREEDLVEEVGRLVGYENIEPRMPLVSLYPPKRNIKNYWLRQIKRHLAANGFSEVYNYSFTSDNTLSNWGFLKKDLLEVQNPTSEEYKYLRPSLAINILGITKKNLKLFSSIQIFEVGEVFKKLKVKSSKLKVENAWQDREESKLCLAIGTKDKSKEHFYVLKEQVTFLLNSLGISDVWFDAELKSKEINALSFMHPARLAQIKIGNVLIGYIGQIHPATAMNEQLKGNLFICELSLDVLIDEAEKEEIYSPVSNFPQAVRDISIIIPKYTRVYSVMSVINDAGGKLLRDVDMFDYYESLPSEREILDKSSMAFHLIFQAKNKTLTSEEINKLMDKINKNIKAQGWEVR